MFGISLNENWFYGIFVVLFIGAFISSKTAPPEPERKANSSFGDDEEVDNIIKKSAAETNNLLGITLDNRNNW